MNLLLLCLALGRVRTEWVVALASGIHRILLRWIGGLLAHVCKWVVSGKALVSNVLLVILWLLLVLLLLKWVRLELVLLWLLHVCSLLLGLLCVELIQDGKRVMLLLLLLCRCKSLT